MSNLCNSPFTARFLLLICHKGQSACQAMRYRAEDAVHSREKEQQLASITFLSITHLRASNCLLAPITH